MAVNPLPDFSLPSELTDILQSCPNFTLAADVEQLIELAVKDAKNGYHEVPL
jgi:hypothetical protein